LREVLFVHILSILFGKREEEIEEGKASLATFDSTPCVSEEEGGREGRRGVWSREMTDKR